ncbi:MAG: DUF2252 family protein [Taibaiella sp.]|nr:DUF2252 family protein [Taibaiella sp.]
MASVPQRIKQFNSNRLSDMVQVKYEMMTDNRFRFYRGTCHLFYEDLSKVNSIPPTPLAWICGDLHLENFGTYKGDNRLVYFDLNDFDEGVLAPASWELVRIVTSIFLAFDSLKIDHKKAVNMAQLFLRSYSATLSKGKAYYIEAQTAKGIVCSFLAGVNKRKQKDILKKKTEKRQNKLQILADDPKHIELDAQLKRELIHKITEWIMYNHDGPYNYEAVDVVYRVAGTGSVGMKRYVFLLKSMLAKDKYLLVDMKQAAPSSLAPYLKGQQPHWENEAQRVVAIQERMQNVAPALLSSLVFKEEAYLIQELQPVKDSINFKLIKDRYRDIYQVIDDMAMLTASAQLRSSGRQGAAVADELIAFGQNNQWQEVILEYATQYAKKVGNDYKAYVAAYKKGYFK